MSNFRHRLTPFLESYGGHLGYSVRPSARGQGHATRLLQAGLEFGRGLGLPALLVTCDPANHASAAVIRRCGVLIDRAWHEGIAREVCRYHVPVA